MDWQRVWSLVPRRGAWDGSPNFFCVVDDNFNLDVSALRVLDRLASDQDGAVVFVNCAVLSSGNPAAARAML